MQGKISHEDFADAVIGLNVGNIHTHIIHTYTLTNTYTHTCIYMQGKISHEDFADAVIGLNVGNIHTHIIHTYTLTNTYTHTHAYIYAGENISRRLC